MNWFNKFDSVETNKKALSRFEQLMSIIDKIISFNSDTFTCVLDGYGCIDNSVHASAIIVMPLPTIISNAELRGLFVSALSISAHTQIICSESGKVIRFLFCVSDVLKR